MGVQRAGAPEATEEEGDLRAQGFLEGTVGLGLGATKGQSSLRGEII